MTEEEALSHAVHALHEYAHHLNWAIDQVGGSTSDELLALVDQTYEAHRIIEAMYHARIREQPTRDEAIPF